MGSLLPMNILTIFRTRGIQPKYEVLIYGTALATH